MKKLELLELVHNALNHYSCGKDWLKEHQPHIVLPKFSPTIERLSMTFGRLRGEDMWSADADQTPVSRSELWPLIDYCYNTSEELFFAVPLETEFLVKLKSTLYKELGEDTAQVIAILKKANMLKEENIVRILKYPKQAENLVQAFSRSQRAGSILDKPTITATLKKCTRYAGCSFEGGTPPEAELSRYRTSGLLELAQQVKRDMPESFAGIEYRLSQDHGDLKINATGAKGYTVLHYLVIGGADLPLIEAAVERGADVLWKDDKQRTAGDCALKYSVQLVYDFLRAEEAKRKQAGHIEGVTPEQQAGTPLTAEQVAAEKKRAAVAEKRAAVAEKRAAVAEERAAVAEKRAAVAEERAAVAEERAAAAEKEPAQMMMLGGGGYRP